MRFDLDLIESYQPAFDAEACSNCGQDLALSSPMVEISTDTSTRVACSEKCCTELFSATLERSLRKAKISLPTKTKESGTNVVPIRPLGSDSGGLIPGEDFDIPPADDRPQNQPSKRRRNEVWPVHPAELEEPLDEAMTEADYFSDDQIERVRNSVSEVVKAKKQKPKHHRSGGGGRRSRR